MRGFFVKAALTVAMIAVIVTQINVRAVLERFTALPLSVIVACLAIAGPIHRFQGERLERELAPVAVRAGLELSARLGFEGPSGRAARGA